MQIIFCLIENLEFRLYLGWYFKFQWSWQLNRLRFRTGGTLRYFRIYIIQLTWNSLWRQGMACCFKVNLGVLQILSLFFGVSLELIDVPRSFTGVPRCFNEFLPKLIQVPHRSTKMFKVPWSYFFFFWGSPDFSRNVPGTPYLNCINLQNCNRSSLEFH